MTAFHPDLRDVARWIPHFTVTRRALPIMRVLTKGPTRKPPTGPGFIATDHFVLVEGTRPPVRVRVYQPPVINAPRPAVLWIHGGGYVIGSIEPDDRLCIELVKEVGAVVMSVDYRLAPEHPFPAAADDCYAALRWLADNADTFGIDTGRVAVGGASAGGGLAAGVTLMAHDRGDVEVAFQLLVYPMLDDRTALDPHSDPAYLRLWNNRSNLFGWRSYLGTEPGGDDVSPYAAAARRADLDGLPPTWIGVGTLDLFLDENTEYARRLGEAGVDCRLDVIDGAYHGFDAVQRNAGVSRQFRRSYADALRQGFDAA